MTGGKGRERKIGGEMEGERERKGGGKKKGHYATFFNFIQIRLTIRPKC